MSVASFFCPFYPNLFKTTHSRGLTVKGNPVSLGEVA